MVKVIKTIKMKSGRKVNKSKRGTSKLVKRCKSIKRKPICKSKRVAIKWPKKMKMMKKCKKAARVNHRSKSRSSAYKRNINYVKSANLKRQSKSRSACKQNKKNGKSTKVNQRIKYSTRKSSRSRSSKNRKQNKRRNLIKKGPKRPRSAYILFYQYEFCVANNIKKITKVSEFAKKAGQKWRQLNKAEKLRYNKMAVIDRKRYFRLTRGKMC